MESSSRTSAAETDCGKIKQDPLQRFFAKHLVGSEENYFSLFYPERWLNLGNWG